MFVYACVHVRNAFVYNVMRIKMSSLVTIPTSAVYVGSGNVFVIILNIQFSCSIL